MSDEKIALEKERLQNLIHEPFVNLIVRRGRRFLTSELGSVDYLIDLNKGFAEIKNIYHPKDKVLKNAEIFERINPLRLIETNGKFHTFENDLQGWLNLVEVSFRGSYRDERDQVQTLGQ